MNEYQSCFVAYLDILGFKSKVMDGRKSEALRTTLVEALKFCGAFDSGGKKVSGGGEEQRTIDFRSRSFSDSIVFFIREKPRDLSQLLFVVRYLQDKLWENQICLRGAITIGDMHWPDIDDCVTVGPALIKAFRLESKVAIYPRIIISKDLCDYIEGEKNLTAYPFGIKGHVKDYIRPDQDGVHFLDLLKEDITREQGEKLVDGEEVFYIGWHGNKASKHGEVINNLDSLIQASVDCSDEKIRMKYEWLRNYKDASMLGR